MDLFENIKTYFKKKDENLSTANAPEGVCPNCWGDQNYDGEYYELKKGNKLSKKDDTYNNFIHKIVERNIVGVKISEDTYTCTSCKTNYKV